MTTRNKSMHKFNQIKSVFIEICNKKNVITGGICCDTSMDFNEFNEDFCNPLMDNIASDKIFLVGDFNIDLLKG